MSATAGMPRAQDRPRDAPAGNLFDKHGSRNPLVRKLMARFERSLRELFETAGPASALDVGCGEGVITQAWAERLEAGRVVGVDVDDPVLVEEWATRRRPNLEFLPADASRLPFADGEFDMVAAIEVLEHVEDPRRALAEMARVATSYLLISVPREPLWRALNLARGAYVREWGNTPGHRHHWSRRGLGRLIRPYGRVVAARAPFPWQMLLVRVG